MALNQTGTLKDAGAGEIDTQTPPRGDANPHRQVGPSPSGDYADNLPQPGTQSARQAEASGNPVGSAEQDGG